MVVSMLKSPKRLYSPLLPSFYINLPIGAVATGIILFTFKTPPLSRNEEDSSASKTEKFKQMDLPGTFVILGAMTCLLLGFQLAGVSKSWSSPAVIGLFGGFGLLTVIFIIVEYFQRDRALMVPHIIKQRVVYVGCIVSFL
jgi:MFS transporter, DHA2 family, glioxin efflux transporter